MPVSLLNVRNWLFDLDLVARRFAQLTAREAMLTIGLIGPSEVPRKREVSLTAAHCVVHHLKLWNCINFKWFNINTTLLR